MHDDAPRESLDELIDDVARSMTAAEPSPGLRAAIGTGIAGHHVPPHRVSWRLATAAAILILVIAIAGRAWLDISGRLDTAQPQVDSTPAGAAMTVSSRMPASAAGRPSSTSDTSRAVARRASRPSLAAPEAIPAAVTTEDYVVIEPLSDGPLDDQPAEVESMQTPMPLLAEWVEIEPLFIE